MRKILIAVMLTLSVSCSKSEPQAFICAVCGQPVMEVGLQSTVVVGTCPKGHKTVPTQPEGTSFERSADGRWMIFEK